MSLFVTVLAIVCVLTTADAEDEFYSDDYYYYKDADHRPYDRILGGNITDITKYPSAVKVTVALSKKNWRHCGGVIVSESWVLTAGNCVDGCDPNHIKVRAGSTKGGKGGTLHNVGEVVLHDKFKRKKKQPPLYDIALIKVTEPFDLTSPSVKAAVLPGGRETVPVGSRAYKVGWGYYKFSLEVVSPDLREVDSFVISNDECAAYGLIVDEYNFCTAELCGQLKSTMKGDSGGPVFVKDILYGVHSSGFDNKRIIRADKHMHIPHFRVWIALVAGV